MVSLHDQFQHLLSPTGLMAVGYLVVLEGVLSVDNALALAALVKGRLKDPIDQKRALTWGIYGAYFFRTLMIFIGVWLMQHHWVKWLAALYLIYVAVKELFFHKKHMDEEGETESLGLKISFLTPLWSTILAVELMDIMFSIDSIAVAFSVSEEPVILIAGAFLGILAMRFAAKFFMRLIDRFPLLEKTAFILVGLAGGKIVLELLGVHVPETLFIVVMFSIIGAAMLMKRVKVSG